MEKFPDRFFLGAATSAYQVEGTNSQNDWWDWEQKVCLKEGSGDACRHYDLYEADFDLAKQLHHNAHRFSVEWSRVEPAKGNFSLQEIEHYKHVAAALRERGIEPIVTLHHFTNPLWFARGGGWEHEESPVSFARYAQQVVEALCDTVRFWVTVNEPMVYVYYSYVIGKWPPQKKSLWQAKKVADNFAAAHRAAYRLIHDTYRSKGLPPPAVSVAQNIRAFEPQSGALMNRFAARLQDRFFNRAFIEKLIRARSLDFIGVNYYTRDLVDVRNWFPPRTAADTRQGNSAAIRRSSLGWEIYPKGLLDLLLSFKRYGLPLFVLENGICTDDDSQRWEFIREHLRNVLLAIKGGVPVLGYIYWSLLDNYEWDEGFAPRFGLVDVNYTTYRRTVRESALKFASACKNGGI